jgi:hypothetical protein
MAKEVLINFATVIPMENFDVPKRSRRRRCKVTLVFYTTDIQSNLIY